MGYAAEKKVADKKWTRFKRIVLAVVAFFLVALLVYSSFVPPSSWKYRFRLPDTGSREAGEMRIHFVDVGQGDAIVIELPDGKTALIDGGDGSKMAEYALMRYLNALRIEVIDYLVVTHADADHCGALDTVLAHKTVRNAYLPLTRETVNAEYASFSAALAEETGCTRSYTRGGLDLSGEEYTLVFLHPYARDVFSAMEKGEFFDENSNLYSAVFWLDYNGVSTLFTGEISQTEEEGLLNAYRAGLFEKVDLSSTEILKVGHHGGASSTSAKLLEALSLKMAVISCGENAYGHPAPSTLERIGQGDAQLFRTDLDGSVIVSIKRGESAFTTRTLGK